jgi:hypothetical protein
VNDVNREIVRREYDALLPDMRGFCGCEICRGDVITFTLNRLDPHYVSTREGEVFTELTLGSGQERARLSVILIDAFRRVALAPRCGATPIRLA